MLRLEFEKPEDETQIMLKEGKLVKAATREKLVERLTDEGAIGIANHLDPFY